VSRRRNLTDADLEVIARGFVEANEPSAAPQPVDVARWDNLEELVMRPDLFGLTNATPTQRLIYRLMDGRDCEPILKLPVLKDAERYPPEVRERACWEWILGGCDVSSLPRRPPLEFVLVAGIRGGKSLLIAAHALHSSQRVQIIGVRPGERPRYSALSLDLDKVQAILNHLVPSLQSRPALSALTVGDPSTGVVLRHPTGEELDVVAVAGRKAGGAVVSFWSFGIAFDEATRMAGIGEGVINLDETREAGLGRMLPGAQMLEMGAPHAPLGPVYAAVSKHHGKPSEDMVVIRAPAPAMNPVKWTPEEVERLMNKPGAEQAYRADVLSEFIDLITDALPAMDIEACRIRFRDRAIPVRGAAYVAAIDPATRTNAWTLVVCRWRDSKLEVSFARQWMPGPQGSIDSEATLKEIAVLLRAYGLAHLYTDQWAADPIASLAAIHGLCVVSVELPMRDQVLTVAELRALLGLRRVELLDNQLLIDDLKRTRKVTTRNGQAIDLPKTPDGRHCDFVPALLRAMRWLIPEPVSDAQRHDDEEDEWAEREAARLRKERRARYALRR